MTDLQRVGTTFVLEALGADDSARHDLVWFNGERLAIARSLPAATLTTPKQVADFAELGRTALTLRHAAIASTLAWGLTEAGEPAIIEEYNQGPTLEVLRASYAPNSERVGGISWASACMLARYACDALEFTNLALRTKNSPPIMLVSAGRFVLSETNTLKLVDCTRELRGILDSNIAMASYRSPEAFAPGAIAFGKIDAQRGAVFSLGALLFELITGKRFMSVGSADEARARIASTWTHELPEGTPVQVADLLTACLSDSPDARPENLRALTKQLAALAASGKATMSAVLKNECGALLRASSMRRSELLERMKGRGTAGGAALAPMGAAAQGAGQANHTAAFPALSNAPSIARALSSPPAASTGAAGSVQSTSSSLSAAKDAFRARPTVGLPAQARAAAEAQHQAEAQVAKEAFRTRPTVGIPAVTDTAEDASAGHTAEVYSHMEIAAESRKRRGPPIPREEPSEEISQVFFVEPEATDAAAAHAAPSPQPHSPQLAAFEDQIAELGQSQEGATMPFNREAVFAKSVPPPAREITAYSPATNQARSVPPDAAPKPAQAAAESALGSSMSPPSMRGMMRAAPLDEEDMTQPFMREMHTLGSEPALATARAAQRADDAGALPTPLDAGFGAPEIADTQERPAAHQFASAPAPQLRGTAPPRAHVPAPELPQSVILAEDLTKFPALVLPKSALAKAQAEADLKPATQPMASAPPAALDSGAHDSGAHDSGAGPASLPPASVPPGSLAPASVPPPNVPSLAPALQEHLGAARNAQTAVPSGVGLAPGNAQPTGAAPMTQRRPQQDPTMQYRAYVEPRSRVIDWILLVVAICAVTSLTYYLFSRRAQRRATEQLQQQLTAAPVAPIEGDPAAVTPANSPSAIEPAAADTAITPRR